MGGRGGVRQDGAGIAEVGTAGTDLYGVQQALGGFDAALKLEGDDAATGRHLLFSQRVLRVAFQEGIMHGCNGVLLTKPVGHGEGAAAVRVHPQVEGFEALADRPGDERRHSRAGVAAKGDDFIHHRLGAEQKTAENAALAVHPLGRGVGNEVGAKLGRSLKDRRGEAIVDDEEQVVGFAEFTGSFEIDEFEAGVRRCFGAEKHCIGLNGCGPGFGLVGLDVGEGDAPFRQDVGQQLVGAAK